jgi:hypothetical protein
LPAYRTVLRVAPRNFDANYLLGVLLLEAGQFAGVEKQLPIIVLMYIFWQLLF